MSALSTRDTDSAPLRDVLATATDRLRAAGVASPAHDAAELAAHVLGTSRMKLWRECTVTAEQRTAIDDLIDERARRVPLQHLTGIAGFRHLELAVGPGVFVPRPETEVLVDWALHQLAELTAPVVVDLCSGSGAIALAVAQELPHSLVFAVEREPLAAAWAERNMTRLGLRVRLTVGNATDPAVLSDVDGGADMVLSNPPYIPDGMSVEREVAEHDPAAALWGGPDGMRVLVGVAARAHTLLRPGSFFCVEHAEAQGETVPALLAATGQWTDIACHRDLSDRPRFTVARALKD